MSELTRGSGLSKDAPGMGIFEQTRTSLLEAAKAGVLTAARWEVFGVRYRPVLVRYCEQFFRMPHHLAEEVVQETLVVMWKRHELIYRPPNKKFRHVLVAVLRYKFLAARAKEERSQDLPDAEELTWMDASYYGIRETAERAFNAYAAEVLRETIDAGRWPDCDLGHDAIEQWYAWRFDERSQAEIAEDYGVEQSTVSRHVDEVEAYLARDGEPILRSMGMA